MSQELASDPGHCSLKLRCIPPQAFSILKYGILRHKHCSIEGILTACIAYTEFGVKT